MRLPLRTFFGQCNMLKHNDRSVVPWIYLWASLLSLGWLLPASFTLWFGFQSEVWIAASFLVAGIALLWKYGDKPWRLPSTITILVLISLIPVGQWCTGSIALAGHAWICSLYLLGFAMAVWYGYTWEREAPGQCLDALFFAIVLGGIATVCLQLAQWRGITGWWLVPADPSRPNGNFGQANLAATFLCWGLCAISWFTARRRIPWRLSVAIAAFLLFGIALSKSRTAFLGLAIATGLVFLFRKTWNDKRVLWVITGLAIYFLCCIFLIQWINAHEFQDAVLSARSMFSRFQIWSIAVEAIREKPWLGYGWSQTYAAQLMVADHMPGFHEPFNSAHNLLLDFILWNGVPLAILLLGSMGLWLYQRARSMGTAENLILGFFILFIANHSLLEFPMHYAFFLLPLGWLVGAIEARCTKRDWLELRLSRTVPLVSVSLMAALLALIEIEYLMVDDAFRIQTLKNLNIATETWREPKLHILNHLLSRLKLEQIDIDQKGLTPRELEHLESVALFAPGPSPMIMVAGVLAMNGQPERARWWLRRICKTTSALACDKVKANWATVGQKRPEISVIPWPDDADASGTQ